MSKPALFRNFLLCVSILLSSAAFAQTFSYNVLIDTDLDASTGCTATAAGGNAVSGIEQRIRAELDSSTQVVSEVSVANCEGSAFGAPRVIDGGIPAGLNNGEDGADVLEFSAPFSELRVGQLFAVSILAEDGAGSDVLDTLDGSPTGNTIIFSIPIEVPVLGWAGLLLLALILLIIGFFYRRRNPGLFMVIGLLGISGIVIAATFITDGQIDDWSGIPPLATDPADDSTNGGAGNDVLALFMANENDTLFIRLDVSDVENQPPVAMDDAFTTDEDMALSVAAPGVLMNDSDANMDPITAVLVTAPANAGSFTLNADGSFDYTPLADFSGVDTFTYAANDGFGSSDPATVSITVNPINDAPLFTVTGPAVVLEDSGAQSLTDIITGVSAGAVDEAGQTLTFMVVSNDNAALFVAAPAIAADGTLTFTPADDAFGTANLSVQLMDDGGTANGGVDTSAAQTVIITVDPVNDAPEFTAGPDQTVLEDAGAQTVAAWAVFSVGPANENTQVATFTVTNNTNAALFSAAPTVDGVTGDLMYTPATDANGTAMITLELMDDGGTADGGDDTSDPQTFMITVTPVNDAPVIAIPADATVLEDAGAQSIASFATDINAGPADESGQMLTIMITGNDNPTLFSVAPALASDGTLTFTPAADANGTANITLELMDDGGTDNGGMDTSAPQNFAINVTAVNDVPSFTLVSDVTVNEDSGLLTLPGAASSISAGPADESGQALTFNVTDNTNAALFSMMPALAADGTLTFTPADNANGTAVVTVELMDDGGTDNGGMDTSAAQMFTITVNAVNDAPVFTLPGSPATVLEDSGAQTLPGFANTISTGGGADEGGQTLMFSVTGNTAPALFSAGPVLATDGTLTFTAAANASGSATITAQLMDNGGTANGGIDTTTDTFVITITPLNDPPVFILAGNPAAVDEDSGAQSVAGFVTGIDDGDPDLTQTVTLVLTEQAGTSSTLSFASAPAIDGGTGALSYTPADNAFGTATFSVVAMDDGGTANGGMDTSAAVLFTITVNGVNDAPTITAAPTAAATTNIQISVPAASGLLSGASDDATEASIGTTLTVGNGANPAPTATSNSGNLVISADGSYTYNPPAGFTGMDTFDYVVCDDGLPAPSVCSAAITVNITVAGNTIWFIDNSASSAGDGRLATPFDSIAGFNAVQGGATTASPAAGDFIFLATGSGNYTEGLTLLNNQTVFGQATTGTTFDSFSGITAAANSVARPLLGGAPPVITTTAAASNGISLNATNTIRGLNIGNTTGFGIAGTTTGTLTIDEVDIVGTGGLVDIDGASSGTLDVVFGELTSTASNVPNVVDIRNYVNADLAATSTTIQSPSQSGFMLMNNTGTSILNFGNLATLLTTNGAGIVAMNTSNVTISPPSPVTIQVTGGPALSLTGGNYTGFNFSSISASNTTTGVILNNVSGFISSGGGNIQNTSGDAFVITGGFGGVTYGGIITNTAGRSVVVTGHTGSNVVFNPINDTGQGVFLNNNPGTSFFFAGTMTLNTGTNSAFTATNGGSVDATGNGSTISTTSGTAVNIDGVSIRNTGFSVQSVSSNGSPSAITLNNTGSGPFVVTGDGTNNQNASGGTIQNTTGNAVVLNNTQNVSLSSMTFINNGDAAGEDVISVSNLGGTNNLIRGAVFTGGDQVDQNYINIIQNAGTLGNFTVDSSSFTGVLNLGNDAIFMDSTGAATAATLTVTNASEFDGMLGDGVQVSSQLGADTTVNVLNSFFNNDSGIQLGGVGGNAASRLSLATGGGTAAAPSELTFTITGNTFDDSGVQAGALPVGDVGVIDIANNQVGSLVGTFANNTLQNIEVDVGLRINADESTNQLTVLVEDNVFSDVADDGITFDIDDDPGNVDITIRNNNVGAGPDGIAGNADDAPVGFDTGDGINVAIDRNDPDPGSPANMNTTVADVLITNNQVVSEDGAQALDIVVDVDDVGGSALLNVTVTDNTIVNETDEAFDIEADDDGDICVNIDSNTFVGVTNDSDLDRETDAGDFNIVGLAGTTAAAVDTFVTGNNTFTGTGLTVEGGPFGSCTTPPAPTLPPATP